MLFVLAIVLATLPVLHAGTAEAACIARPISVSPTSGLPGSTVTVSGKDFYECHDVIVCQQDKPCESPPPAPLQDIRIWFNSRGRQQIEIGRATGPDFAVQVAIPMSARAGEASISASMSESQRFRVLGVSRPVDHQLPRTGSTNVASLMLVGIALIIGGALSVRFAHRRSFDC